MSALQAGLQKRFVDILSFDDVHNNNNNKIKAYVVAAVAHPYFKVDIIEEGGWRLVSCWSHSTWGKLLQTTNQWRSWYQWRLLQLYYARLKLWSCWLWMQGWCIIVFVRSITWTWAADEVSSSHQSACLSGKTIISSCGDTFSQAGLILTFRRNKLSDESFETLLLLKKNKMFV